MKDQGKVFGTGMRPILFLLLGLFVFLAGESRAQEVTDIEVYVESRGLSSSDPFLDLRYGSGGIIELAEGSVILPKVGAPTNVMLKSSEVDQLPAEPGLYGSVQFMQINLAAGSSFSLDYGQLASFPGLRYVLVVSPVALSSSQLSQMFSGFAESGITLFYQISRPG